MSNAERVSEDAEDLTQASPDAPGDTPGDAPGNAPPDGLRLDPEHSLGTVAVFTRKLARTRHIAALLGARDVVLRPAHGDAGSIDAVVGWGQKSNTAAARRYAERHDLPYWRAEDGFLRSVGLGAAGEPPLSVVLDDRGVYYDARTPSRLEALLSGPESRLDTRMDQGSLLDRARTAIERIRRHRLSKYNDAPPVEYSLGARPRGGRVLVVDQTRGDLSVRHGLADADSFAAMVAAAVDENPGAEIVVKTHPDVVAGKKQGYLLRPAGAGGDRVRVVADRMDPYTLFAQVDRVYAVTSQLGFEAVLAGLPVTLFGAPFYAGWGLTDDRAEVPRRGLSRTVEQVFAAAYILYPRYIDPDDGSPCDIERVIDHLALQRELFAENRGRIYCFGFRIWKHNYVRAYLRCPGNQLEFPRNAEHAEQLGFGPGCRALVWGQRETAQVRSLAARHDVPLWRMEDGFLRSVGLGSDLVAPASLVVDREGIYYDPTGPSELETILQTAELTSDELVRARELRRRILDAGVSKYNVGDDHEVPVPAGRRVVLVPGQVEDDASVQLGSPEVRSNLALLERARAASPDSFLIYKPHPDVLSGNRRGRVDDEAARRLCDHIETDASLDRCLQVAHEVHVITSLVGYEALLRELRVVVYGRPFYAGWGLTEDAHPVARRTRERTLDELVACALIRYPRYLNRRTGRFTTPEVVIDQLTREREQSTGHVVKLSWPKRQLRKLVHIYRGVTDAP